MGILLQMSATKTLLKISKFNSVTISVYIFFIQTMVYGNVTGSISDHDPIIPQTPHQLTQCTQLLLVL